MWKFRCENDDLKKPDGSQGYRNDIDEEYCKGKGRQREPKVLQEANLKIWPREKCNNHLINPTQILTQPGLDPFHRHNYHR